MWGCYWGDDSSWKIHYLDLSQVQDGVIARDQRFGHVEIAANGYMSPCLIVDLEDGQRDVPRRPHFIGLSRHADKARVQLSVQLDFDLASGDRRLPD